MEPGQLGRAMERWHQPLQEVVLELQVAAVERSGPLLRLRARKLACMLEVHIAAEEGSLLPAWERTVQPPPRGAAREVFTAEHARIVRLLAELEEALQGEEEGFSAARAVAWIEKIHPLKALMHHHELREEQLLAPELDARMDPRALVDLVAELERAMAPVQGLDLGLTPPEAST